MRRKARRGEDSVFILDEFSAVTAAAPMVIGLAERVRDVGGQVIVSTQGYQGLGTTDDDRGQRRAAHDLIASATAQARSVFADPPAPTPARPPAPQTRPRPQSKAPRPDDDPWWGDP